MIIGRQPPHPGKISSCHILLNKQSGCETESVTNVSLSWKDRSVQDYVWKQSRHIQRTAADELVTLIFCDSMPVIKLKVNTQTLDKYAARPVAPAGSRK